MVKGWVVRAVWTHGHGRYRGDEDGELLGRYVEVHLWDLRRLGTAGCALVARCHLIPRCD